MLFKYYRGCLKLRLGDIQTANSEYLEFVYLYSEEIQSTNSENKYTSFIKLQNDLLNIKNFGKKSSDEVIEKLQQVGLSLQPNPEGVELEEV